MFDMPTICRFIRAMADVVLIVFGKECMKEKDHQKGNSSGETIKVHV